MSLERFILKDAEIGISKGLETLNTPKLLASEYDSILCDQLLPSIPSPEMITGEDQVGDGTEGPHAPRNYRWPATPINLTTKLNNEFCSRLAKRQLGGTLGDTTVATGVYDHAVAMQTRAQGHDVQLSSIAMIFGGADFIYSSMAVNEMTIAQVGTDVPTASFAMLGSGLTKRFRDVYRSQTIATTGTPAGGTFTLDYGGVPVVIGFNDSAATIKTTLLAAIPGLTSADVTTSGGPLPTAVTVAFQDTSNWWAKPAVQFTLTTNGLTGGSSPAPVLGTTNPYLVLPAVPDYEKQYMHGSQLAAVMNNGSVLELTTFGLLQSSVRINQQVEWKSLPGLDAFPVSGFPESAAYMGCVARGERIVEPSVRLYLDSKVDEYYWQRQNLTITDLIFTHKGSRIGSTAYNQEFEIGVHKLKLRSTVLEADGTYGAKTLAFLPILDTVTGGFASLRVRDGNATLV